MKVYFSCALTGGRGDQPACAALVRHLQEAGHDVLTAHLAAPGSEAQEEHLDDVAIYARDMAWVRACEVLIAEVSTPSHGVGYEIASALARGKPVLCCHRQGARVSRMITGNRELGMVVAAYGDPAGLLECADRFLQSQS